MSLYLKYRPKTLEDIVGQAHITDILHAQAAHQHFSQNYLLYGPRGTWKTSTARIIAKLINCTTFRSDGTPDLLNDPLAQLIDTSRTLDIVEIDAASHTGVDNVREEIIEKAPYPPTALKQKVYIIDEVHMLSKGAFNALLKIMEEPPKYLTFILATTELHKVPETIISRCHVFQYKKIGIPDITARLSHIASLEDIQTTPGWIHLLAKVAWWWLRDAVKYLEQISLSGVVDEEHVTRYLWLASDEQVRSFFTLAQQRDLPQLIAFIDSLSHLWTDLLQYTKSLVFFADEHFLQDPKTCSDLIQMAEYILAKSKYTPSLSALYKAAVFHTIGHQATVHQAATPQIATPKTTLERPESQPVAPISMDSTDISLDTSTVVTDSAPENSSPQTWSWTNNNDVLLKVIAHIKNPMISSILRQHTHLQRYQDNVVHLIVVNENYHQLLLKPETMHQLEQAFSTVYESPTTVDCMYMSKQDFVDSQF